MSYILDAIKRAEKQRRLDQVPTLESVVSDQYDTPSRLSTRYLAIVGVVVLIALAGWFYKPIGSGISSGVNRIIAWSKDISSEDSTNSKSEEKSPIETENNQGDISEVASKNTPETSKTLNTSTAQTASDQPDTGIEGSTVSVSEAQRRALDNINFSVVSYSKDATKRFVMNGAKILREGDVISGFPILEINEGNVVLGVNGQKYILQF